MQKRLHYWVDCGEFIMTEYPRPRKKSALKRFRENFEMRTFLETVLFVLAFIVAMLIFVLICYTVKGPTYGFL